MLTQFYPLIPIISLGRTSLEALVADFPVSTLVLTEGTVAAQQGR